jgi:NAD(P)-dependent dehydrogenase (short-subunit alcohol dehydrogenase family)
LIILSNTNKNILCFGANSFLAKAFNEIYVNDYNILNVYRKSGEGLYLDFEKELDAERFALNISDKIDGIVFFQGINPSVGLKDMTSDHFSKMIKINLIMPTMVVKALRDKMNISCSVIFFSSVAKRKGSYDPSYASAKSAIVGLVHSLANECSKIRFNILSLGLVEGSPVHAAMTADFIKRHTDRMYLGKLINKYDVVKMIAEVIRNEGINRSEISLDGGFL